MSSKIRSVNSAIMKLLFSCVQSSSFKSKGKSHKRVSVTNAHHAVATSKILPRNRRTKWLSRSWPAVCTTKHGLSVQLYKNVDLLSLNRFLNSDLVVTTDINVSVPLLRKFDNRVPNNGYSSIVSYR